MSDPNSLLSQTVAVVSAYVGHNGAEPDEVTTLLRDVHATLSELSHGPVKEPAPTPAVPIEDSIQEEALICLENGKPYRSLKRHLKAEYGMTPDEYREKWGLPSDYPMVAPGYSKKRSALAKKAGLGRKSKAKT